MGQRRESQAGAHHLPAFARPAAFAGGHDVDDQEGNEQHQHVLALTQAHVDRIKQREDERQRSAEVEGAAPVRLM